MENIRVVGSGDILLECFLIKTKKRITFDILYQHPRVTNSDPLNMKVFRASNGYEVISEHRMDIQSRRVWLLGASNDEPAMRSGTLALPVQSMCDETFPEFLECLGQWAEHNQGMVVITIVRTD